MIKIHYAIDKKKKTLRTPQKKKKTVVSTLNLALRSSATVPSVPLQNRRCTTTSTNSLVCEIVTGSRLELDCYYKNVVSRLEIVGLLAVTRENKRIDEMT